MDTKGEAEAPACSESMSLEPPILGEQHGQSECRFSHSLKLDEYTDESDEDYQMKEDDWDDAECFEGEFPKKRDWKKCEFLPAEVKVSVGDADVWLGEKIREEIEVVSSRVKKRVSENRLLPKAKTLRNAKPSAQEILDLVLSLEIKELMKEMFRSGSPSGSTVNDADVEGFLDTLIACAICNTSPTGLLQGSSAKYFQFRGIRITLTRFFELLRSLEQKKSDREESNSWGPVRSVNSDVEKLESLISSQSSSFGWVQGLSVVGMDDDLIRSKSQFLRRVP